MVTNPNVPETTPETPPTSTPTITFFQQLADQYMKQVDGMSTGVPDLEERHPSTSKFVRGHQSIPDAFIASAVAAMEQTPSLLGVNGLDPVTHRSDLQYVDAFTQLVDKVGAFYKALRFTVQSKRANLAAAALQTYYLSKGLGRTNVNAATLSHVENMKRDLGKRGRRKKQSSKQQPTPQTPAPQAPAPQTPTQTVPEPRANAAQA